MTLAHIRSGTVVQRFNTEKAWLTLEDGRRVSPVVEGFADGNDKVVPVVSETVGAAGPDTNASSETIVEADRVVDRITYTAMTQAEIDARAAAQVDAAEANVFQNNKELAAVMITLRDALVFVRDGNLAGLTNQEITDQLKSRFRTNFGGL